ncbi:MAG: methyltransferase domain-containing protein [Planctomycetes bacterium]|nr:methyltransferase domain-containing protein [Planctomycetota bacterium]
MNAWLDRIMARRARKLTERLRPWISAGTRVADVGSGTGHNAMAWRLELGVAVDEFDVADLHWVGGGPIIFDGLRLPAAESDYHVVTVLFALHFSPHPSDLLQEIRRIAADRVIVIQSTYRGRWGQMWLNIRGFLWGPVAWTVARLAGAVQGNPISLVSQRLYSRDDLRQLFQNAGLTIRHWEPEEWWGFRISRDLIVLDANRLTPTSHSSSQPAMKSIG